MQAIGDLFANNKVLFVAILVVVLAVVAGVAALLSRLVFGGRISPAGGRTRQPRLGVVDAFDLDRQRQLVIVRRDNVEHLLMIGGPNDLLIETAIVRAAPSASSMTPREKDDLAGPALPPVQAPRPAPAPAPAFAPPTAPALPGLPIPSLGDPIGPSAVQKDGGEPPSVGFPPLRPIPEAPPVSAGPNSPRPTPSTPTPPRPAPPPIPRAPVAPPTQAGTPAAKPVFSPAPPRPIVAPAPRSVVTPTRATPAIPAPLRGGDQKRAEEPPRTSPPDAAPVADNQSSAAAAAEPVVPLKAPPQPVKAQRVEPPRIETPAAKAPPPPSNRPAPVPAPPAVPMVKSLDALESLEEEMAKLLGRPVPPAEKS